MEHPMTQKFLVLFIAVFTTAAPVLASESPYSGLETREIKALSKKQIEGYLTGQGMRLALPGELNGYPGPRHVLEMDSSLDLSEEQREAVEEIFLRMKTQAIELGNQIVEAEAALDQSFSSGEITAESLRETTGKIGLLKGRLRAVHLAAHLETKDLLTLQQIGQYAALRGYHSGH
jgi:hypothetical protein